VFILPGEFLILPAWVLLDHRLAAEWHFHRQVLRAFAVHLTYRLLPEARTASELLKSRFFQSDAYKSYHDTSYWLRFGHAFW
jgi:hypothetical protein